MRQRKILREEVPEGEETPGITSDDQIVDDHHIIETLTEVLLCDESSINRVEVETRWLQLTLDLLHSHIVTQRRGERGISGMAWQGMSGTHTH